MSRVYWRKKLGPWAIALGLILVATIIAVTIYHVTATSLKNRDDSKQNTTQIQTETQRYVNERCLKLNFAARHQCIADAEKTAHTQEQAEADLYAQRQMAIWALAVGISGLVSIPLSLAGILFVWRSLALNRNAVIAATTANAYTVKALAQEQTNAQRQLRAYLHPILPNLHVVMVGHKAFASINIKNFGQTPAYDVKSVINFDVLPVESEYTADVPDISGAISKTPLPPQEVINHEIFSAHPITDAEFRQNLLKTHAIFVTGIVHYKDAFGQNRETEYRYMSIPDNNGNIRTLKICAEGNRAT